LLAILLLFGMAISAQDFVDYLNGIAYVFPSTQGGSDQILTNDGTGGLTWSDAPTPEGLWSGSRVFSTVSCPTGWTRVSAMDDRVLRGSGASGGTGGSDTHVHGTLSGVTGSTAPSVTGSSAGSSVSISGSTSETSISHGHGVTPTGTAQVGGFPPAMGAWTSVAVNSSDPGHSHGVGTLTGGSHTHGAGTLALSSHGHGTGTLAAASASSLAAYYGLIVCEKD
jgi:hypothetical protein